MIHCQQALVAKSTVNSARAFNGKGAKESNWYRSRFTSGAKKVENKKKKKVSVQGNAVRVSLATLTSSGFK